MLHDTEHQIREKARRDGITHLSTGVAIISEGKILIARRAASDFLGGVYELPGGGVDAGERIVDGACREVLEETGLKVREVIAMFDGFDYSTDRKPSVRQFNFLVSVAPGAVTLDPAEHDAYAWIGRDGIESFEMTDTMRVCLRDAFALL